MSVEYDFDPEVKDIDPNRTADLKKVLEELELVLKKLPKGMIRLFVIVDPINTHLYRHSNSKTLIGEMAILQHVYSVILREIMETSDPNIFLKKGAKSASDG